MEQLGDYLVRRLVGEGGMGKVYEAEERLSKRRVALKVLHQDLARSEEGRRLFVNEMQILAHLEHPNIVRSLASTEVDGQLVMVLEFLEGKTLRSTLSAEGRLPWADAVHVGSSVASALAAAHGQAPPIIHRDLKPENIMVLEGGAVKVMDFGIAKVVEALHQTNTQSVGTLQYMSPEQIDAHTIDHRSDLYCLGLVLYEMLTGRPPFQSSSPRQLLNLQCTAEPPPFDDDARKGLPKGVEQLVFQLLEKAPEDRPYLAEDVVERLEPFQTADEPRLRGAATSRAGSVRAVTPHRSGGGAASKGGASPADRAKALSTNDSDEAETDAPEAEKATPGRTKKSVETRDRKSAPKGTADTIALVQRVEAAREIPTKVAAAVIVALSILAGIGAYLARAADDPVSAPAFGASAEKTVAVPTAKQAP